MKGRAAQVVATIGDIEHQLIRVKDKEKLAYAPRTVERVRCA